MKVEKKRVVVLAVRQNRIMPESHTEEEWGYIELYALSLKDGSISETSRAMLAAHAKRNRMSERRIQHVEAWHKDAQHNESWW